MSISNENLILTTFEVWLTKLKQKLQAQSEQSMQGRAKLNTDFV